MSTDYSVITLRISQLSFLRLSSLLFLLDTLDNRHRDLVHQIVDLGFQLVEHIGRDEEVGFVKVLENEHKFRYGQVPLT